MNNNAKAMQQAIEPWSNLETGRSFQFMVQSQKKDSITPIKSPPSNQKSKPKRACTPDRNRSTSDRNRSTPQKLPQKSTNSPNYNFCKNLRKYEQYKAKQLDGRVAIDFIERNRRYCRDHNNQQFGSDSFLSSDLHEQHLVNEVNRMRQAKEPISVSQLSYIDETCGVYQHPNIANYRKNQYERYLGKSQASVKQATPPETDRFQKILKLKDKVRRKKLRSASKSRDGERERAKSQLRIQDDFDLIIREKVDGKKFNPSPTKSKRTHTGPQVQSQSQVVEVQGHNIPKDRNRNRNRNRNRQGDDYFSRRVNKISKSLQIKGSHIMITDKE